MDPYQDDYIDNLYQLYKIEKNSYSEFGDILNEFYELDNRFFTYICDLAGIILHHENDNIVDYSPAEEKLLDKLLLLNVNKLRYVYKDIGILINDIREVIPEWMLIRQLNQLDNECQIVDRYIWIIDAAQQIFSKRHS